MQFFKSLRTRPHQPSITKLVARWLGCLVIVFFLLAALCGLLFYGLSWFAQRTRAQGFPGESPPISVRHHLVLVDQSGSVMNNAATRALMRTTAKTVAGHLREADDLAGRAGATIRVEAFGAIRRSALPTISLQDPTLDAKLEAGLPTWESLGATAFEQMLTSVLSDTEPISDVVLITDGIPDPVSRSDVAARKAYANTLLEIAQQFSRRGIPVVVVLIGEANRAEWVPVWREFASSTGGVMREVKTLDVLDGLAQSLTTLNPPPIVDAPSTPAATVTVAALPSATSTTLPTSTPTATPTLTPVPSATPQPTPTATPEPTLTLIPILPSALPTALPTSPAAPTSLPPTQTALPAPIVTALPAPAETATSFITPLSFIGLCVGSLMLLVVIAIATTAAHRRTQAIQRASLPVDEGVIEIHGTTDYSLRQIDLSPMALGEVWHIGQGAECDIQLGLCQAMDSPVAALVMTAQGPLLESRSTPLIFGGRPVQRHALLDDDQVHLDCYVLRYQNLLRRREAVFDKATPFMN